MDNFYCLIKIINNTEKIEIYCFRHFIKISDNKTFNSYPLCFTAYDFNSIFLLLSLHYLLNLLSLPHILYLGKELFKAELALFSEQIYIQE